MEQGESPLYALSQMWYGEYEYVYAYAASEMSCHWTVKWIVL